MFALSNEQIAVFTDKATDEFTDKAVAYVRDNFPRKFSQFGENAVLRHVQTVLEDARGHGFETERQIISYLDLGLRFGRVTQAEWAQNYLDPASDPPERRMRNMQHAALRSRGLVST